MRCLLQRELTRGLGLSPRGGSRSLYWSEIGMEDPQEDRLAVHCFCVCSGSVLLGDLLGVMLQPPVSTLLGFRLALRL